MHLFYTPDIDPKLSQYFLSEEESKHAIRVLRLEESSTVTLVDGKGGLYQAEITDPHPKRTILRITSVVKEYQKRNHYLHVAIAPTKNIERVEWFLEKATEIGIDEISLIICKRSERKEAKLDRLNKIITSAVKQSIKAYHPVLNEAMPFKRFVEEGFDGEKYIAHCDDGEKFQLAQSLQRQSRYLIMIGPEGDFSPDEVELASCAGFKPLTLGESRLRTETAALEACFEVNFLNRI